MKKPYTRHDIEAMNPELTQRQAADLVDVANVYQDLTPFQKLPLNLAILRGMARIFIDSPSLANLRRVWQCWAILLWPTLAPFVAGLAGGLLAAAGLITHTPALIVAGLALVGAAWLLARELVKNG